MARAIPTSPLTPADELRHLLDVSEKRAVNINGAGPDAAAELLQWLDRITYLLPELEAAGGDMRPERVRWLTLQGSVRRHAKELQAELAACREKKTGTQLAQILAAKRKKISVLLHPLKNETDFSGSPLTPGRGLAAYRQAQSSPPPAQQWWWWLDVHDRQQRHQTLRKLALTVVIIVALLWGGRLALHKFFPVNPQIVRAMELRTQGDRWLADGSLPQAIASYEAALAVLPDDTNTQLWLAAMYSFSGQEANAAALRQALISELGASQTHAGLGQVLIQLGDVPSAVSAAKQAIAEDPQNPNAYLTLGGAYEAQGAYNQAAEQFERAATIAEQTNQAELIAIARVRQALVLQRIPMQKP